MPLSMTIDELLAYTAGERDKWQQWFEEQRHEIALETARGAPLARR